MARKKISPEERREIERAREIKKRAKNRKPEPDDENKEYGVCAICDDGGAVTSCDGVCQRSFHLADEHDEDRKCRVKLGLTVDDAKMIIEKKEFMCRNCKYKQHQCFVCGLLGSSDLSSQPEVFQCEHDDCGQFYHPECVAKLLYPDCELKAALFKDQVFTGHKFTCPMHECIKCRGGENKDDCKMQFAVCGRCPTVYHRDCLPSDILFEKDALPKNVMPRAWDNVLPGRILFYCMKHKIVKKLRTPKRNNIIFPDAKKIRVPKMLDGPLDEPDKPDEEGLLDQQPMDMEEDKSKEEELIDQQSMEQARQEEDKLPDRPTPKSSQPPPAARDRNRRPCSCSFDSFAPSSLFPHPHPGSGGWIED